MKREIFNNGNILSVPSIKVPHTKGLGQILFEKMSQNKESVAQIDGLTGEKDTFGSILQRSIRAAITMRSKGITSKDIVTICSWMHLDTNIPIIASLFLGVRTASTDPSLTLADTVQLLNQVRPKMVFASPNAVKLIEDTLQEIGISSEIVVFDKSNKHSQFSDFLVESPEEENFLPVKVENLKETASVFFSSGTSGMPKGVCVNHLSMVANMPQNEEAFRGMVTLNFSTPYWISSFAFMISSVFGRTCRIIFPTFDVSFVWSAIEKFKVSMIFLSPSHMSAVISNGRPQDLHTSSVRVIYTGGAPISKEQLEKIETLFPTARVGIGFAMTELGGGGIFYKLDAYPEDLKFLLEKRLSCGRPLPGYAYKIVDPETEEVLGANQKGELRIKTEYQMNGYHNLDSSKAWDQDGFLKTGDVAYYDKDYCFYIVDRLKELLKFQSWQIAPAKLEAILLTHPAVESAVVIGLPDPADGDHPMGVVVLNKSGIEVTPIELEKYVEERVNDKQRLRGGVKIVKSIPVTVTGKFKRREIRDLILQGKL